MYDFNGDKDWENIFFESIENSDVQHIKGIIKRLDGIEIVFDDSNLLDGIHCESQCTENEEIFNFGEMYIGSAEIKVKLTNENINLIKGGELRLYFQTGTIEKWLPLGVWDIVSAERENDNIFAIKGYDHLNRLNTPVTDNVVGVIFMKSVLRQVAKDAGVEFAQTIEEIQKIAGNSVDILNNTWGTEFLDTCWNEIRAIAQFLGCFAFANREGKIEFRKFSRNPVLEIPAEKRFSAKISDYQYSVKGISYKDGYGNTVTYNSDDKGVAILGFSDNKYIWETEKDADSEYSKTLERIACAVGSYSNDSLTWKWSPGTIEYYGNPALDVGDMVEISGGVNGKKNSTNFLITHISWQFRGTQTLVSGGMPESGTVISSSTSGSSGTITSYTTINTTSNISVVEFKKYIGEIFGTERIVAKTGFSSRRETWFFLDCTLILSGDGLISTAVYLNEIAQTLRPKITLHNGETSTLHFSFTTKISGGRHNIRIGVCGNADIADIQAFVWGQDITEESPEITDENDYIYTTNNGITTVTGYIGKSLYPQIPDDLGNGKTLYIDKNSFSDSKIESVYIPDGVTEIR